jgi:hypothetical protein
MRRNEEAKVEEFRSGEVEKLEEMEEMEEMEEVEEVEKSRSDSGDPWLPKECYSRREIEDGR